MTQDPIRILVVEDDCDDFVIVKGLLSELYSQRLRIIWRQDYESALIELQSGNFDVCLFDFRLGRYTGLDLLERASALMDEVPIIFLTGHADRELDLLAMEKGASDFLMKAGLNANSLERSIRYSMKKASIIRDIRKANAANEGKTRFLANMSHEIRTPLSAILGFSELALDSDENPENCRQYLNVIQRNAKQLLHLINDILDLSKVEAGQLSCELLPTDIRALLSELESTFRPQAEQKNLRLETVVGQTVPAEVELDPTRLRQILVNLIGNGIKFTSEGHIKVSVTLNEDKLEFRVSDTGLGLTKDQQRKLFHRFSQADDSMTRKFGGTGLGLALSRELASLLDGSLVIEDSQTGVGTTFKLRMPVKSSAVSLSRNRPAAIPEAKNQLAKSRILLVEDSEDNRELISVYLERAGAEVSFADNGKTGLEMAQKESFDAILMDIQMPEMDGIEATQTLRSAGFVQPIIALTANAMKEDRENALRAGFSDYITKPIDCKALTRTILSHIGLNVG